MSELRPSASVAPLSTSAAWMVSSPLREAQAQDLDEHALAQLVRARLALEKSHGWVVFACFAGIVLSVFLFGGSVENKAILGVYAAAVASAAAGLGFGVERLSWRLFLHLGRVQGLSEDACLQIFERAAGADRWIEILEACGKEPTDAELASFVCPRAARAANE